MLNRLEDMSVSGDQAIPSRSSLISPAYSLMRQQFFDDPAKKFPVIVHREFRGRSRRIGALFRREERTSRPGTSYFRYSGANGTNRAAAHALVGKAWVRGIIAAQRARYSGPMSILAGKF